MSDTETSSSKYVAQHNALTFARYDMSAAEKDIFFITLGKLGRHDSSDKIYEISVKDELSSLTGKEKSYEHIKQTAEKLSKRQIKIESLEEKKFKIINLVSSIEYKGGVVYMQLTDSIRPYLFNLKEQFTKYGLQFALSLNLKYSKRFYEMLSSWKSKGEYSTTLDDLHDVLQIKKSYKTWDNFKRKVIEPSVEEINEKTNLMVSYEVRKTGRKFTHIKFLIHETIKVEETVGGLSQWQLEKIEALLTEEQRATMRYWAKLAFKDFNESTGIKNTGVFWASFAEWFAKEHYKVELGVYTGKMYFHFDPMAYKPGK